MVYSTRRFVLCLPSCYFVLVFFSSFSVAITSLGEERANLCAFRTFVRFVFVWFCLFSLPLCVWEWVLFVIVCTPLTFHLLFFLNQVYRYHKLRKPFFKCYRHHFDIGSKLNEGLKSCLQQGLWEPEFYDDSTVASIVPCGDRKSLNVHNHSAGYILFPLGFLSPSWLF